MTVPESTTGILEGLTPASWCRTLMLPELQQLLRVVPLTATLHDYKQAIVAENVLLKRTQDSRTDTYRYLRDRYALDPCVPLFRALRDLWDADPSAQPLLAMLMASARDPVLRATAETVLPVAPGSPVTPAMLASAIASAFPGHFRESTLAVMGRLVAASWTQSGHLVGRAPKRRGRAVCRPVAVAFALLIGHLTGVSGDALFLTPWVRLLDAPAHIVREQAVEAALHGWIEYRHAGNVTDVGFRFLLKDGNNN